MLVFKKGVFNGKNNNETVELNKKGKHDLEYLSKLYAGNIFYQTAIDLIS